MSKFRVAVTQGYSTTLRGVEAETAQEAADMVAKTVPEWTTLAITTGLWQEEVFVVRGLCAEPRGARTQF